MAKFEAGHPWPAICKDLGRERRGPVIAVIAYVGVDSPQVALLRKGDALVCDADPRTIARASTSASALSKAKKRGVAVFSCPGLHAKVIASRTFAWVGSANASNTSTKLIEASVRLNGKDATTVHTWALTQCTEDRELTATDLKALEGIKVKQAAAPVLPVNADSQGLPDDLLALALLWTEGTTFSKKEGSAIAKEKPSAHAAFAPLAGPLEWIMWTGGLPSEVKVGKWLIDIRGGHPRPPQYVVRISDHGSFRIIWTRMAKTAARPKQAALAEAVGRAWDRWLDSEESALVVRGQPATRRILDLYRA